jgi:hypothetical protein
VTDNEQEAGGNEEEETVVEESAGYDADGSMQMSPVSGIEEGEETEGGLSPSLIRKDVSTALGLASVVWPPPLLKQPAAAAAAAAAVVAAVVEAVVVLVLELRARPNAS